MQAALAAARAGLDAGDAVITQAATRHLLEAPPGDASPAERGEAWLCQAQCALRLTGQYLAAVDAAQQAVLVFQQLGDDEAESRALATHAIAATRLGHFEKAVDSALLAVRLLDVRPPDRNGVLAYHALAIACHSGGSFEQARNAYEHAIQVAQQCEPPLPTFELHADLASTEALRIITERQAGGQRLSLDALARHVGECRRQLAATEGDISLAPASHGNNLLVLYLTDAHLHAWQRDFDGCERVLAELREAQVRLNRPWMLAAVRWAEAELALARDEREVALALGREMVSVAETFGHEALVAMGVHLVSHVCELSGDAAGALRALRQLARRERQGRVESLQNRVHMIERQLELRHNRQRVQLLETDSRLFQKLAMEDVLTGLANRRQFEASLAGWLAMEAAPSAPLCLAMIDVDHFKGINDGFSHQVGDQVLQGIARVLREQVREHDLPARLAGDEFVVVLRQAGQAMAEAVCERIRLAVAAADWSGVAPGLRVGISIGVTQAQPGEGLAALMQRADACMYARKRQR